LSGYTNLLRKADQLVTRTVLALLTMGTLLFAGLSLLGHYPPEMAYYRGLPIITWYSLGATAFLMLLLTLHRRARRE
jgi:ubiquinone biosynthesis protein